MVQLVELITSELNQLDGLDEQFAEMVREAAEQVTGASDEQWRQLQSDEQVLEREEKNLGDAIAQVGPVPMLGQKIKELEDRKKQWGRHRHQLESLQGKPLELPVSVAELRDQLQHQFKQLALNSYEFGDLLRQLVPEFHVYLVRLCDGGHLLPRARVTLHLGGLARDVRQVPALEQILTRKVTLDLFKPRQRERIRPEAVALHARGWNYKQIAAAIAEQPSTTAVTNSRGPKTCWCLPVAYSPAEK